jgi:hypothetical protein
MFVIMAERSTNIVGWCTCQKVPERLLLHVHQINWTRLNMSIIIIATCSPWKKETIPVPDPPFITLAPTLKIAATTIGQHQAPIMAGRESISVPMAPSSWPMLIGSNTSPSMANSGGGPHPPPGQSGSTSPSVAAKGCKGSLAAAMPGD